MVFSWSGSQTAGMVDRCLQWWHHCPLHQHMKGCFYIFRALSFITMIPRCASLHLVHFLLLSSEAHFTHFPRCGLPRVSRRGGEINGSVYLYGPCLLIMDPRGDSSIATEEKSLKKHCSKEARAKSVFGATRSMGTRSENFGSGCCGRAVVGLQPPAPDLLGCGPCLRGTSAKGRKGKTWTDSDNLLLFGT